MRVNHSFKSFYNKDSEILILGSFPSVKSREKSFYYMNKTNRFWKVLGILFDNDFENENIIRKKELLSKYKIALYDVIEECEIIGSSDSSIKNVKPIDLQEIIDESNIKKIFINGATAYKYFEKYFKEYLNMCTKLPSTSAANAKMKIDDLLKQWSIIKIKMH